MSHFLKKCRACGIVLGQCRCPALDKTIEWGECKRYPECGQHSTAERQPDANYRQMCVDLTAERDALRAELERRTQMTMEEASDQVRHMREQLHELRAEVAEATGYLGRLFLSYAPQCTLLPSLLGICTQIDNCMVQIKDLRELREAAEACVVRGGEPHLYYPPSPAAIGTLRAVLAKVST